MKLETGKPIFDARYVVYVEGVMGWLEPHIVVWHEGHWKFLHSTEHYPDKVFGWIGPLPVMSKSYWESEYGPKPELEFDL